MSNRAIYVVECVNNNINNKCTALPSRDALMGIRMRVFREPHGLQGKRIVLMGGKHSPPTIHMQVAIYSLGSSVALAASEWLAVAGLRPSWGALGRCECQLVQRPPQQLAAVD